MSAEIIQFVPKPNPNRDVLARITGVPACSGPDDDPQNPNVIPDIAPSEMNLDDPFAGLPVGSKIEIRMPPEYVGPENDPA